WKMLGMWGATAGTIALAFNLICFVTGYFVPKVFGVEHSQAVAIAMELGVRNTALAITMALSEYMLNDPEVAIPPALYGLIAYLTGGMLVLLLNRLPLGSKPENV